MPMFNNPHVHYRLMILITCLWLSACGSSSNTTPPAVSLPTPQTYNISNQAEFEQLTQQVFNGGDKILFQRGSQFSGHLSLQRSDIRPQTAITIADYGSINNPRPIIEADIQEMGTIDIRDSGGWVIENLELINQAEQASERFGIYITATDSGEHKHFIIRNCLIHHVTGQFDYRENGGILLRVTGNVVPTWFDGVLIENNQVRDIAGVGIRIKSSWQADVDDPRGLNAQGRYAHLNVVVRGNRVSNTTYNAIIIASADAPLAEYNVMGPNISTGHTGNTFYFFATDSAVAQYNEAFGNNGPITDKDRAGYDADYGSRNTVFRYNYSHHNNFAFSIMRKYGDGIYIHHNVSENERYAIFNYGFPTDNAINNVVVSNNTFYSDQPNMRMFRNFDKTRLPIATTFVDNIFVFSAGDATWGSEVSTERGNRFENNIVVGLNDAAYNSLLLEPELVDPGTGGTEINMLAADMLKGDKLCLGSAAIGQGQAGHNDANVDFWGEDITSMNIGAYGGTGINCP